MFFVFLYLMVALVYRAAVQESRNPPHTSTLHFIWVLVKQLFHFVIHKVLPELCACVCVFCLQLILLGKCNIFQEMFARSFQCSLALWLRVLPMQSVVENCAKAIRKMYCHQKGNQSSMQKKTKRECMLFTSLFHVLNKSLYWWFMLFLL